MQAAYFQGSKLSALISSLLHFAFFWNRSGIVYLEAGHYRFCAKTAQKL
jgi:hypothetical protein